MKEKCSHKSFEKNGNLWKCQWECQKSFTAEEVEKLMIARRQGFVDKEVGEDSNSGIL